MKQAPIRQSSFRRSFYRLSAVFVPGFVLSLLLAGCGSTVQTTTSGATVSIAASPSSVAAGASSTLTVTAANATAVTVTGSDGSSYTLTATGGTQSVTPTKTTTYTATATGTGASATATATVTVTAPLVPTPTVTLSASPASVVLGSASTLTVTFTNATAVTITGGASPIAVPVTSSPQTVQVSPSATTTYTATATGATGSSPATATATATVTVTAPPPTVSLTASAPAITVGQSSNLIVTFTNATAVTITGGATPINVPVTSSPQTVPVSPAATTTYTATVTGGTGTTPVTATATVTVTAGPPTVTISASPASVPWGTASALTVAATNAGSVVVTGTDNSSYTLPAAGGTQSVTPSTTTTYTAKATGASGTTPATKTAKVTVTYVAPTGALSASPNPVGVNTASTLSYSATSATTLSISGTDGSHFTGLATGQQTVSGTEVVTPTAAGTITYTLSATGPGGGPITTQAILTVDPQPTVTIVPSTTDINLNGQVKLLITATNSTAVTLAASGSDTNTYTVPSASGGTVTVTPTSVGTATYTATATGAAGTTPATSAPINITVGPVATAQSIKHVIFMMQENHTFDNYFGMLNPYRKNPLGTGTCPNNALGVPQCYNVGDDGNTYNVDGIDDKLTTLNTDSTDPAAPGGYPSGDVYPGAVVQPFYRQQSTCIDDDSSDWLASFGDVYRWSTSTNRPIQMNGFVHTGEGYANSCYASNNCIGDVGNVFTDLLGARAMGYYDQTYLNYYYYLASQYSLSDRWFSPVASKSVVNRIATFSGGTTQGLVHDPSGDDHLTSQLAFPTIFRELNAASPAVSWKIYYSETNGECLTADDCTGGAGAYPSTWFESFTDSYKYIQENPGNSSGSNCAALTPPLQPSSVVGDSYNSFCIDPTHIAPITQYFTDLTNDALPQFVFIEPGYGISDEHPGSGQPILQGQLEVAKLINAWMGTFGTPHDSYSNSVFFLAYDEGGGPYDHVPPVPGHSNDFTINSDMGTLPAGGILDIGGANGVPGGGIAVNPDGVLYWPCVNPTPGTPDLHCDLADGEAGSNPPDDVSTYGFAAQLGFRIPNMVISPFAKRHYVSHVPMDHTAIIRFVEDLFINNATGNTNAAQYLTQRDAAQPNLLDFFDFANVPWATPPTPPSPYVDNPWKSKCTPANAPMNNNGQTLN